MKLYNSEIEKLQNTYTAVAVEVKMTTIFSTNHTKMVGPSFTEGVLVGYKTYTESVVTTTLQPGEKYDFTKIGYKKGYDQVCEIVFFEQKGTYQMSLEDYEELVF